jgi:hypothetical protein
MQISRHWRLNNQRYRLEGMHVRGMREPEPVGVRNNGLAATETGKGVQGSGHDESLPHEHDIPEEAATVVATALLVGKE